MYHDYYRHKTWEAKHYWVNQFGIIEHDIFAHILPPHYVVKWKRGVDKCEKHFDNKYCLFLILCSELFRWNNGEDWYVLHYLFHKSTRANS